LYSCDLYVYPEDTLGNIIGGPMSVPPPNRNRQPSSDLRLFDRLTLATIGVGVIFASLGLGEAVYRLAFFDFDGATDRLPIEMMFGLAFAWMTMKLAKRIYQHRMEALARIDVVWDRNHKIRHALQAIEAVPLPSHQQAIRVIRDEVDRIEWALNDVRPRAWTRRTLDFRGHLHRQWNSAFRHAEALRAHRASAISAAGSAGAD
jgi:hypothetical protein